MQIEFLAAESLGVRSMATLVRTKHATIFIDPGAALGPKRYGLPPDKLEWQRLWHLKDELKQRLKEADIVIVTHYHYDHYDPEWAPLLKGKRVFLKDPERHINRNQAKRAREFLKRLAAARVSWAVAEGQTLFFGATKVSFSPPLQHGPETRFGAVVAVAVHEDGEVFLHSSDVSGPVQPEALAFMYQHQPRVLYIDGPGTYLGARFGLEAIEEASRSLVRLVQDLRPEALVLDHHLLRDLAWRRWAAPIFEAAGRFSTIVTTAAGFMGQGDLLLEAERRQRYKMHRRSLTLWE